jgi:hypothetical protein
MAQDGTFMLGMRAFQVDLLLSGRLMGDAQSLGSSAMTDVLFAAAWIVGEFSE